MHLLEGMRRRGPAAVLRGPHPASPTNPSRLEFHHGPVALRLKVSNPGRPVPIAPIPFRRVFPVRRPLTDLALLQRVATRMYQPERRPPRAL